MIGVYIAVAVFLFAFIIVLSLLLNARKVIRGLHRENDNQVNRHSEACHKYGQQIEKRNGVIKTLLHERLEPETLDFFIHLTDPSSHIPDNIFEKVDSYQEHIAKKNKDMGYGNP